MNKNWVIILIVIFDFSFAIKISNNNFNNTSSKNKQDSKQGKIFSLFSVVSFQNVACQTESTILAGTRFRNGTCFTTNECTEKGGLVSGACAAGFGVCCLFQTAVCGATVTQNCSYVRNPGFPNTLTTTTACTYTINKVRADICTLRLDFERFTITGPVGTAETATGGLCATASDTFSITNLNTGNTNNVIVPVICGQNTGQHMYIDIGANPGDAATLTFAFAGASTVRIWEIKVTQFFCFSDSTPPNGCLQYHTDISGRFTSFNFLDATSQHLGGQFYNICLRQEEGYCCVKYNQCADANSFDLGVSIANSGQDTDCRNDYIEIIGSGSTCAITNVHNRFCSKTGFLSTAVMATAVTVSETICDCTTPWRVGIVTDALTNADNDAMRPQRGVCLEYEQVACGQAN